MNLRLVAILLLLWIAWMLFRKHLVAWRARQRQPVTRGKQAKPMVPCSYCQVHLPQDEALEADGLWFCSRQHRQAWLKGP